MNNYRSEFRHHNKKCSDDYRYVNSIKSCIITSNWNRNYIQIKSSLVRKNVANNIAYKKLLFLDAFSHWLNSRVIHFFQCITRHVTHNAYKYSYLMSAPYVLCSSMCTARLCCTHSCVTPSLSYTWHSATTIKHNLPSPVYEYARNFACG